MKRTPGEAAPDFDAECWDGGRVKLADADGKRTWLAFFRYASCPLCNLRVHQMITRHERYEAAGLRVLAVFQSAPASIAEYVGKQAPPFPLICDPEEKLYALYGLNHSKLGLLHPANAVGLAHAASKGFLPGKQDGTVDRLPADFLLGPDLRIEHAYYAKRIGEHIPFERVDAFLGG
jgi:peroxiredoxin